MKTSITALKGSVKEKKKDFRSNTKNCHITIENLECENLDKLVELAWSFKPNVSACLVGLEENHEEGKGIHAHIVIQFTTKQKFTREQVVKHFGSDAVCIKSIGRGRKNLMRVLGYASKARNSKQKGNFKYKGQVVDDDFEGYRFSYMVVDEMDAIAYFKEVIAERLLKGTSKDGKDVIEELANSKGYIGSYLVKRPTLVKQLKKLACQWYSDKIEGLKKGLRFADFVSCEEELEKAYIHYLSGFEEIFLKNRPVNYFIELEKDFADYVSYDLEVLQVIFRALKEAMHYGPDRPHKSLNLHIWSSKPSFGKTRLLLFLKKHLRCYRLPDDQYYLNYKNGFYTVLASDEAGSFLRTKSYSHLKHLFEGVAAEFNLKGREKIIKNDNPLIILCENRSFYSFMKDYYKYHDDEVMASRIIDIELRSRATLHFLIDHCLVPN